MIPSKQLLALKRVGGSGAASCGLTNMLSLLWGKGRHGIWIVQRRLTSSQFLRRVPAAPSILQRLQLR